MAGEELAAGSEFTTVDYYDTKVKARAYELYLTTDLTLTDIAIDIGVNAKVVGSWARQGDWRKRKQAAEDELFNSADDAYRRIVAASRGPTIERHLRISGKLENAIETAIDELTAKGHLDEMKLRRLSEALASVTGVSARAAAISDKPFSDANDRDGAKKRPLILIGVRPGDNPAAITAEYHELPEEGN